MKKEENWKNVEPVNGMIGLVGKPGAGKGIESLRLIVAELMDEDSERIIVTNCNLNLKAISAYLAARGRDVNVWERVVEIGKADNIEEAHNQVAHFYLRRSLTFLGEETRPDPKGPPLVDFSTYPPTPCLYVIDEAHEQFNSRDWQSVSKNTAVLAYISKHRHLGDGVVWISQTIASIDKQFRERSQEYRVTRNWSKEKFGKFSKGTGFQVSSYLTPPGKEDKPQWVEERNPTKEFLGLYSTSIYNRKADVGRITKGLNIRKWAFAIIPLGIIVPFGLWYIAKPFIIGGIVKGAGAATPQIQKEEGKPDNHQGFTAATYRPSGGQQEASQEAKEIVYQSPDHWAPLIPPGITEIPVSQALQRQTFNRNLPKVPLPCEAVAWTGSQLVLKSGDAIGVGDRWHGLEITEISPKEIRTGDISHPVRMPWKPPTKGILVYQGRTSMGSSRAYYRALLDGRLYAIGDLLPDGNVLYQAVPPRAHTPEGYEVFYVPEVDTPQKAVSQPPVPGQDVQIPIPVDPPPKVVSSEKK